LREIVGQQVDTAWSLATLARSGVRFLALLDSYDSFCRRAGSQAFSGEQQRNAEEARNVIQVLELWIDSARHGVIGASSQTSPAQDELSQALATGRLLPRIERLRALIQTLLDGHHLMMRLDTIESTLEHL
jgi:hypothetical protein